MNKNITLSAEELSNIVACAIAQALSGQVKGATVSAQNAPQGQYSVPVSAPIPVQAPPQKVGFGVAFDPSLKFIRSPYYARKEGKRTGHGPQCKMPMLARSIHDTPTYLSVLYTVYDQAGNQYAITFEDFRARGTYNPYVNYRRIVEYGGWKCLGPRETKDNIFVGSLGEAYSVGKGLTNRVSSLG